MQLIREVNEGVHFSLFFIDIFSQYGWFIALKNKKLVTITNAFQKDVIANKQNVGR